VRILLHAILFVGAAAVLLFVRPDRDRALNAADVEEAAWGASDPTWSPDGRKLAFSLFGSIWQVSVQGGIAEQLSSGVGYHAHPSWSPHGDRIAFVSGAPPAGARAQVAGKLMLLEVPAGRERELKTPHPIAGTLAWSPDGTRIATGLGVPGTGSLLHEIEVATGRVTQLQFSPQNPRGVEWERLKLDIGAWVYAAWNPLRNEIFLGAEHIGAPQIWSIPSTKPPILIPLPLTAYRQKDIVWLSSVSALPDGTGVIYSADLQNGKGNYEIYRVPRSGGTPFALTNTVRDEFSPAVSPDGRLIAHVSNHLGNIDLFLMPVAGGKKEHVRITRLKFRGPSGQVRLKIRDERDQPTAVRLYARGADAKAYAPQGSPLFYLPYLPGGSREGFSIASGEITFSVPAGPLRLVALKGIEYRDAEQTITVSPGETAEMTIAMQRWTNWNQRGWYSGENHFHANYNGSYYQRPKDSLQWLEAEDLNVANMIVANKDGAFLHDKEFFRGAVDPLSSNRYVLYWGQEYRNSDPLGHMVFLNLRNLVPPYFTSVVGSNSPYDYPLNTMAARQAQKQGAFVSYTHPMVGRTTDPFDTWLGAKEIPIVAAVGGLDALDIMPDAEHSADLWYRLLNCGFRIAPGAGTDVFTNWRGINTVPGAAREYVDVGSAMSWDRWLRRYREGRVFVTNGPLLTFEINGQPMGSQIDISDGEDYQARLTVDVQSRDPLRTVEFIQNGEVIERRTVDPPGRTARFEKNVVADRSCWFAVRVTGSPVASRARESRAHSGPIYIRSNRKATLVREDLELMLRWIDRLWSYLDERNNFGPDPNRQRARAMFDQARQHYAAKLVQAR
jgi:TolB protein